MTKEELTKKQTEEVQGGANPKVFLQTEEVQGGIEALSQTEDFPGHDYLMQQGDCLQGHHVYELL